MTQRFGDKGGQKFNKASLKYSTGYALLWATVHFKHLYSDSV